MSKKVAKIGIFVALAMVFSYIEVLIPFSFGIPGVKLGIANIVVVTALYLMTPGEAFMISMVRIFLIGILFGNGVSLLYSFTGGILSFLVMYFFRKRDWFSVIGVSVLGGVFHNLGQILSAALVIRSEKILYYFPVLLVAGVLTGALIGFLSEKIVKAMKIQSETV